MPPQLALILCTIFVVFLLKLEHKQSPDVSAVLWIPTIWMLLIWGKPLGMWFNVAVATNEEGSGLDRIFLIVLFCIAFITLKKRNFIWSNAIKRNVWLIMLILVMLVSCIQSDIPFISFRRWTRQVIALSMAFVVTTELDSRKALESIFRRMIYITIPFSYVLINYFGEYGRLYVHHSGNLMWIGVTGHKNQLCQLCLLSIFFLVWTRIKRKQGKEPPVFKYQTHVEIFMIILSLYLIGGPYHRLTYSATSIIALVVGLVVFAWISWKKKQGTIIDKKILLVIILFLIIYGTITPMIGKLSILDISSLVGREENLTGRTVIWNRLLPAVIERPLLGYGFSTFWTTKAREFYGYTGSHNGYLEVILNYGLVGLVFNVMFLLSCSMRAQRIMTKQFFWGALYYCWILITVTHNISEASIWTFESNFMSIILLLSVVSAIE